MLIYCLCFDGVHFESGAPENLVRCVFDPLNPQLKGWGLEMKACEASLDQPRQDCEFCTGWLALLPYIMVDKVPWGEAHSQPTHHLGGVQRQVFRIRMPP